LIGCSSPDPTPVVPPGASAVAQAIGLGLAPVAVDERGMPRLLQAASDQTRGSALEHVAALAPAWGVDAGALPALQSLGDIPAIGGSITRVRQQLDGLPIEGGELRVMTDPTGKLIAISGTLVGTDQPRTAPVFALDDAAALAAMVGGALVERSHTRRMWLRHDGALIPGWIVEAYLGEPNSTHSDLVRARIAADGRVLDRRSLVEDVAFRYRVFADPSGDLRPLDGPIADVSPHPTGVPDGNFPGFIAPTLVTVEGLNHPLSGIPDPWLPSNRTETFGNNVEAYADLNAPSGLTFGDFRATTTSTTTFDRTYDTAAGPLTSQQQQMASVTSLFFIINWLHDFWYDAGFTEAAGNAQDANFGRGGEDRDALLAEAQDNALGGSRNNANMATPSDGLPPRMQVFLWSGLDEHALTLQPSGRTPAHGIASYGVTTFEVTAALALADDATGDNPRDLCEPLIGDVAGKIVLVDRGNCTFESKALKIQQAGGVGMLVANNVTTAPPTMGDDVAITEPITIAQLSILQTEGDTLKTELAAGTVTATMQREVGPELDGAIDATLIAHEFGHYLHHRLQQCTSRMCSALSEGWGDFLALMIMTREGDDLAGAYPFAVYATRSFSDDAQYFGIRRVPYSVNPAINALSFRHMSNGIPLPDSHPFLPFGVNHEVHNAGEIWTTALWEAYVALQSATTVSFDATRKKMASYLVSGLLLAPVDGTPTETRDALLIAARAASQTDHDTLAQAFARRGLGSCAVSPLRDSFDFAGIVESNVVSANVLSERPIVTAFARCDEDDVIDAGETGRIVVAIANRGGKPLTAASVALTTTTPGVTVASAPSTLDLDAYASTTLAFDIDVDESITEPREGAFEIAITGGGDSCQDPQVIPIKARINVDDVVASSTTDTFDAEVSPWQVTFVAIWQRLRETALDAHWHGVAPAVFSDGQLESPLLTAGVDPVTMTFEHRYSFEATADSVFDGGVVEISFDGTTWQDVQTLVTIPYGTTPLAGVGNALAGRVGFTGDSPGYPATETVTLDFGTQLASLPFKIRFRLATDNSGASVGWDIDNVAFTGLAGTPFPSQTADATACEDGITPPDGGEPAPSDDAGCCETGSGGDGALVLAIGVLVALRRRRARSSQSSR
jgi:hypothetical protein